MTEAGIHGGEKEAPGVCGGRRPEPRRVLQEGQLRKSRQLLRRLSGQQTDAAQFLVSENHFLAAVVVLDMPYAGDLRIAAKLCFWHPEEHRRAMLVNAILNMSVHRKAQTSSFVREQIRSQTLRLFKSLFFNQKETCWGPLEGDRSSFCTIFPHGGLSSRR